MLGARISFSFPFFPLSSILRFLVIPVISSWFLLIFHKEIIDRIWAERTRMELQQRQQELIQALSDHRDIADHEDSMLMSSPG